MSLAEVVLEVEDGNYVKLWSGLAMDCPLFWLRCGFLLDTRYGVY